MQRDTKHTRIGTPHDSFTYSMARHQLGVSIGDVRLTHPPLPSAVLPLPVNVMLISLTYIKREWVTCIPRSKLSPAASSDPPGRTEEEPPPSPLVSGREHMSDSAPPAKLQPRKVESGDLFQFV